MPLDIEQAMSGGKNRAQKLYDDPNIIADYFVGLEGAVVRLGDERCSYILGYVHVIDHSGVSHG